MLGFERIALGRRVTARQVLDYFVEHGRLVVPIVPDDNEGVPSFDPIALKAVLQNVQHLVVWARYSSGPHHNIQPNPINILKPHQFLRQFLANRAFLECEHKREVILDKSYL